MENSVLGNALDGVPEESEEEEPQPNDSNIESANNLDGQSKYNIEIARFCALSDMKCNGPVFLV